MKTLYISDLDGTLLDKEASLSPYTVNTLNDLIDKGLNFSIATARSIATIKKILAPLHLKLPVILMNGVIVYDMKLDKFIDINYLTDNSLDYIFKILKTNSLTGFMYEVKNQTQHTYYENLANNAMKEFLEERVTKFQKLFTQIPDFSKHERGNIIYISLLDKVERLRPVYELLKSLPDIALAFYKDVYTTDDTFYLEIFSVNATKYNAVMYLRKHYQYDNIIGFGDNLNDLPLFKACDTACAVENGREEVKEIADYVIESNVDDGVARFIRRHYNG